MHPYILPNFMDIFNWSIPFVIEKVLEMLHNVIKIDEEEKCEALGDHAKFVGLKPFSSKGDMFRAKIRAVSKMMLMFKTLRTEQETIFQLKGLCPDNKIPKGLLLQGRDAIVGAVDAFQKAKHWDIENEKRPT